MRSECSLWVIQDKTKKGSEPRLLLPSASSPLQQCPANTTSQPSWSPLDQKKVQISCLWWDDDIYYLVSGIRSSSQIFESNRVVDTEDDSDEELDYYDYYDSSDDVTNTDDEVFRSQDPVRPDPAFSSSTFPPPEDRFADIDQNDLNSFRWGFQCHWSQDWNPSLLSWWVQNFTLFYRIVT